jgi:hypothetical protein
VKLDVNRHQTDSSELNSEVALGVANQMSGVSSATPDTPLAPPLFERSTAAGESDNTSTSETQGSPVQ